MKKIVNSLILVFLFVLFSPSIGLADCDSDGGSPPPGTGRRYEKLQ